MYVISAVRDGIRINSFLELQHRLISVKNARLDAFGEPVCSPSHSYVRTCVKSCRSKFCQICRKA